MGKFIKNNAVLLRIKNNESGLYCSPAGPYMHYLDRRMSNSYIGYHLYIFSNDEIKAGDWVIWYGKDNEPFIKQVIDIRNTDIKEYLIESSYQMWVEKGCKKIIATTNTSLKIYQKAFSHEGEIIIEHSLTKQIEKFIDVYINSYTKYHGNKPLITDVEVEYEEYIMQYLDKPQERLFRPKVNEYDGSLSIRLVKEFWPREEVISLIKAGIRAYVREDYDDGHLNVDKWIENNL
jgi:hypothetical protein